MNSPPIFLFTIKVVKNIEYFLIVNLISPLSWYIWLLFYFNIFQLILYISNDTRAEIRAVKVIFNDYKYAFTTFSVTGRAESYILKQKVMGRPQLASVNPLRTTLAASSARQSGCRHQIKDEVAGHKTHAIPRHFYIVSLAQAIFTIVSLAQAIFTIVSLAQAFFTIPSLAHAFFTNVPLEQAFFTIVYIVQASFDIVLLAQEFSTIVYQQCYLARRRCLLFSC